MDRLRELLIKHEGVRLKAYKCPAGKITIGVGRNLEDVGISKLEAMAMLEEDIARIHTEAVENFAWFKSLNCVRQDVVLSMIFNLGFEGFNKFAKLIAALINGNFDKAADEMLASKWSAQVGKRAVELAQMMRSGSYNLEVNK